MLAYPVKLSGTSPCLTVVPACCQGLTALE